MSRSGKFKGTETLLTHKGRHPEQQHGFVNTPITRGSTIVFPNLDGLETHNQPFYYGRGGTPNSLEFETLLNELEKAEGTVLTPSGLSAISVALLSCLSAGDDVLVSDSAYDPTRTFCNGILARMGVTTRYFDPRIGAGIAELFTDKTKAVFTESPGSLTFEIQDLPAIATEAKKHNITVLVDNSWASPLYYQPLTLGADIVIHAGTKMFVGHSDALFGTVSANASAWTALKATHKEIGICASPDDIFLAARGMRTLSVRMKEHQTRALDLASWLEKQDMVSHVVHPGLPSHPDHAIFKRDFTGSGSLFGVMLKPGPRAAVAAMVDQLELYAMGYSWGGYESLILPVHPERTRTATSFKSEGNYLRIHVGFEDMDDLKTDLAAGLERYRAALS